MGSRADHGPSQGRQVARSLDGASLMPRKALPRSTRAWMITMAHETGHASRPPLSVRVLLRQLHAIHTRMESLDPSGAEYVAATGAYGKVFDRLRGLSRRRY